jgi:hypothetical protein
MNGVLGIPFRFHYQASGNTAGLFDIVAKVRGPNGELVGIFNLVEMTDQDFRGVYYFDLLTNALGPEGEYTVIVLEGTSGIRSPARVSFHYNIPKTAGQLKHDIIGKIDQPSLLKGVVAKVIVDLSGTVQGKVLLVNEGL